MKQADGKDPDNNNRSVLAGAGCAERGEEWGREAREENSSQIMESSETSLTQFWSSPF